MKKQEAIKVIKEKMTPINEVIKDKKLIYFIDKMNKKGIKEHKKMGCVQPETLFVLEKSDGSLELAYCYQEGEDKYKYFNMVEFFEKTMKPKYIISMYEGFCVSGFETQEDINKIYEQYGALKNHPECFDSFNISVKTQDEIFSGMAIVEGKKVGSLTWSKQEKSAGECNFTSFSA
ncbi:hypothetical protein [Aquitalea pelogenes]|uniref:hypothetical protein n=1 Tax=Aquitalea pelogenes TaxID=1293573 RepID=UPI0035ADD9A6